MTTTTVRRGNVVDGGVGSVVGVGGDGDGVNDCPFGLVLATTSPALVRLGRNRCSICSIGAGGMDSHWDFPLVIVWGMGGCGVDRGIWTDILTALTIILTTLTIILTTLN